jgi:hypothetical protein
MSVVYKLLFMVLCHGKPEPTKRAGILLYLLDIFFHLKNGFKPGMVVQVCNPSSGEAEAEAEA